MYHFLYVAGYWAAIIVLVSAAITVPLAALVKGGKGESL